MLGKKSNEIDEFTGELVGDEIIFIANPTTGKLLKTTYAFIREYFNKDVSIAIKLDAGASSYHTTEGIDIKVIKFEGSREASIGVGTTSEVNDIYEAGHLAENSRLYFEGIQHIAADETIYFNGVETDTITTIFKL